MNTVSVRDLLSYIVENLVQNPDKIEITELTSGDTLTLQLKVAPEDMGKVIGRQGRIAKEIRILAKAAGARSNQRIMVDILD